MCRKIALLTVVGTVILSSSTKLSLAQSGDGAVLWLAEMERPRVNVAPDNQHFAGCK